ncbi:hypothetical protein HPULCUR_010325 [Helicostylum pulchrum]|uniref:BAR-domain-containing protein n=1 Tax=Helicostylum pulchrum TaxID=562976 RepID=A0ABP9YEX2_9FUNG
MSWKGVKKSISRLPHNLKTRNGGEDADRDLEYQCLESRYKQLVQLSNDLCSESMAYRDALSNILNDQLLFANHLTELYGLVQDQTVSYDKQQGLNDYTTAMEYCREETMILLDDLDARVIKPASNYQMITKSVDKIITKRQHKLIDFDRHKNSYLKYSAITEPSPSEEKNMIKLKIQFETAQQDYNYYNDMLKDDLVKFLNLTQCFIEPVLISFYNIQCRVFAGFYGRVHEVIQHNQEMVPTLHLSIETGYTTRVSNACVVDQLDGVISHLKRETKSLGGKGSFQTRPIYSKDDSYLSNQAITPSSSLSNHSVHSTLDNKFIQEERIGRGTPPPLKKKPSLASYSSQSEYTPQVVINNQGAGYNDKPDQSVLKKKRPPPPPPPSKGTKKEFVEALYDLEGSLQGDLSFSVGDRIEVLEKSDTSDDWWKGKIGNQVGMFPANYVRQGM